MKKYKVIGLIGKAGAGKDTVMRNILSKYPGKFHEIISCTTRPPREGEVDGKNYYFITPDQFYEKVKNGEMLESTSFRDWWYGTSLDALDADKVNIGVFNITGIYNLVLDPTIDITTYWICASDKTRLIRQLSRETHPDVEEIIRRYKTDNDDFALRNIQFQFTILQNENYEDMNKAVERIGGHMTNLDE